MRPGRTAPVKRAFVPRRPSREITIMSAPLLGIWPSARDGSDVGTRPHEPLRIDWFKFLSE
jgi:hypothetical protein